MFAQIASKYDLMNHLLSLGIDRYWRWWTVRKLKIDSRQPILDVCTGTGDLALAFSRASGGTAPVIGADFCREMLHVGESKWQRALAKRAGSKTKGRGQLTFVEADTLALPFADDTFEIISVAFGLRNVSDTDGGLREMTRVCRAGGKVAILEFSMPSIQPLKAMYGWYFRHVLPRVGQLLANNRSDAYNYLPESVSEFPSGVDLANRMRAVGLQEVEFFPLTLGVATLYVGTK